MKKLITLVIAGSVFLTQIASAVSVSPVRLVVPLKSTTTILRIENQEEKSVTYDVRILKWTSVNAQGEIQTEPTDSIASSRPTVTIPAHKTSTIRFVTVDRSKLAQDTYRVILTDITPKKDDDKVDSRITISLPLVVNNSTVKGHLDLVDGTVKNTGNSFVRIVAWVNKSGANVNQLRYLLPGDTAFLNVGNLSDVVYNDDIY